MLLPISCWLNAIVRLLSANAEAAARDQLTSLPRSVSLVSHRLRRCRAAGVGLTVLPGYVVCVRLGGVGDDDADLVALAGDYARAFEAAHASAGQSVLEASAAAEPVVAALARLYDGLIERGWTPPEHVREQLPLDTPRSST